MATCAYCGSTILFGGKKDGDLRFCNDSCYQKGFLVAVSNQVPDHLVQQHMQEVHMGNCPKCNGRGPIDVHTSYRVWSMFLVTSWNSIPQISCRSCGIKSQLTGIAFSGLLGWWGIPWGIIITPVQIVRNIAGIISGPDPLKPSPRLENLVRLNLAGILVEQNRSHQHQA